MSFWCLHFLPKKMNENKSTSSKVEFVRSFFGRNVSLKKSFRICLTFRGTLNTRCKSKTLLVIDHQNFSLQCNIKLIQSQTWTGKTCDWNFFSEWAKKFKFLYTTGSWLDLEHDPLDFTTSEFFLTPLWNRGAVKSLRFATNLMTSWGLLLT